MAGEMPPNMPPDISQQIPPSYEPPDYPPGPPSGPPMDGPPVARTIPWEERSERGWFDALIENIKMVLGRPTEFYEAMPREGDMGSPVIYALILGTLGGIAQQVWTYLFGQWFGSFMGQPPQGLDLTVGLIVFMPVLVVAGLFITAGFFHICLAIVGGAKSGFESTLRVVSYSGSANIFILIPVAGSIISGIWGVVLYIIGLAKANNITYGRAAVAVFLPIILCCACGIALAFFIGSAGIFGEMMK